MMRAIKILVTLAAVLLVLLIILMVSIPHIIDFNEHKDELEAAIHRTTGYEVRLIGDIELAFVPWLIINTGEAAVANPPGFEPDNLASVRELQARLRVFPLLMGRIEMERIILHGLDLKLIKDQDGRPNWVVAEREMSKKNTSGLAWADEADTQQETSRRMRIPEMDIAGLEMLDANISYQDLATGQHIMITDLNLDSGRITQEEPFEVTADWNMTNFEPRLDGRFSLTTTALLTENQSRILLTDTVLDMDLEGDPLPEPIHEGRLQADIDYAFEENVLEISNLSLQALDGELQGHVLAVNLDAIPEITFELEGENWDLDRLINAENNYENNPEINPTDSAEQDAQIQADQDNDIEEIDLSFLHEYRLDGTISMSQTTVYQALIDELSTTILSGDGRLELSPLQAFLYQGTLEGSVFVSDVDGEAHVEADYTLSDVQVGPLLNDVADMDFLTGRAEIISDLRTFGTHEDMFIGNLFGSMVMEISEGTIRGIDLDYEIRDAFARVFGEQRPVEDEEGITEFSAFTATYEIASGIAVSEDLSITSPVLEVQGDMRLDLPESHLDSRSRVFLDGALKEEIGRRYALPDAGIPLRIRGPFDDVRVTLDVEFLIEDLIREDGERLLREFMDRMRPEEENNGIQDFLREIIPR